MSASIVATGLRDMQRFFEELPEIAEQAAVYAINDTVQREGLTVLKRDMRDQVEFPPGYLEGDRLKPTRFASRGRLEAVIRGRDRPTSLARFAQGQTPENTGGAGRRVKVRNATGEAGVRVRVNRNNTEHLQRAFLIRLKNGNIGLAVRTSAPNLRKSQKAVELEPGLFLLYGPSVDQVLRGVATDRADDILDLVSSKFLRQFGRLSRG